MDTSQYMSLFIEESSENIENLNQAMLELEKDPQNIELIGEIFRYAHTLKGMSATMGFTNIAELTHTMENVLAKLRNKEMEASKDLVTVLFECVDTLEKMINTVSEGKKSDIDTSVISKKLKDVAENKLDLSQNTEIKQEVKTSNVALEQNTYEYSVYDIDVLKQARDKLYNPYKIVIRLIENCQLKSARAYLIFNNLQEHGEITKSEPSAEKLEKEEFDREILLLYVSQREKDIIEKVISGISDVEYYSVEEIDVTKLIKAKSIEAIKEQKVQAENVAAPAIQKKASQSVRVDLDRLDKFMNLVGELVIHRTRLEQISSTNHLSELNETLEQVGRITSDLQDLVMKVRMIPLEKVFGRLPRMVRDLSTELNKEIDFQIYGQDTELDRTVIDELGESIVHLLRNSVDHGIESSEERIKKGKNPTGKVTVTAYQQGNKAIIKVEDDGRGLDLDKIKQKAINKGINIDALGEDEIKNLIFMEGLSTKEKVTDVSGRGVGMDVVKTKVTSIGGSIDIYTEKDKGTTFVVNLPLTLSIIQALLIKVADETFAISLGFIENVINISEKDIILSNNKEVILYRDDILRIFRLSDKLKLSSDKSSNKYVVIVKIGEKQVGIVVDSLIGQQEIVIKPLLQSMKNIKQYVGATILGDGHVTLILDIVSIVSER